MVKDRHTILITGTSRGIGQMLAAYYLAEGRSVIGCSRTPATLDHAAAQARYRHFVIDITDESAVKDMMGTIRREGGIRILVNNAGAFSAELGLVATGAALRAVLEQNVIGGFLVTREALKIMAATGFGRVINISSIAVPLEESGNAFYAASKQALDRITRQMARELRGANVTVNSVGLSFVEGSGMYERMRPDALERYRRRMAIGRPISIRELAYVIDFFAGDLAGALTGQTLYFGGPS